MKVTKQCSECGGREIYTTEGWVDSNTRGILPDIGSFLGTVKIDVYVCGNCGHHQVFVRSEELAKVKERYDLYK